MAKATPNSAYGRKYRVMRAELLKSNPMCHWNCGRRATTADHEPPIAVAGVHYNLVPACAECNYGRQGKSEQFTPEPSRDWYADT